MSPLEIKLYLAGPEVFLPNAVEHAKMQRTLCEQYGFMGLHPMDNNIDVTDTSYATAIKIYGGDIKQIHACDIVVANCNQFRGALMDDGTAYDLGFANALEKPSYGYCSTHYSYNKKILNYGLGRVSRSSGKYCVDMDAQGYSIREDFGTFVNLMMQCGMTEHGGRLIIGSFEDCLKAVREDIDTKVLVLKK